MEEKEEKNLESNKNISDKSAKQEKIHDLIFNYEIGWQEIIYDLINTDELDPWDIDLVVLTNKFLEKIHELEENYFISSKVLLAAALLLRIKSEILLNKYIKSIDEILFGKKEESNYKKFERIELEDEIPDLIPRSPLPRLRKVTLKELIDSLNKAIVTENRRIRRQVLETSALREAGIALPKRNFTLREKIKEIYEKLLENKIEIEEVHFDKISGDNKEEKIIVLSSLLHLEHQDKVWLHQDEHFGSIYIWKKKTFLEKNKPFEILWREYEEEIQREKAKREKREQKSKEEKSKKNSSKNILQE